MSGFIITVCPNEDMHQFDADRYRIDKKHWHVTKLEAKYLVFNEPTAKFTHEFFSRLNQDVTFSVAFKDCFHCRHSSVETQTIIEEMGGK